MNITGYFQKRRQLYALIVAAIIFFLGAVYTFVPQFLSYQRVCNIFGIFAIFGLCYAISFNRSQINLRLVGVGMLMHMLVAFLVLKTTSGQYVVSGVADAISSLYLSAGEGVQFLFGKLSMPQESWGFIFAIKVLPIIIFFGAFMSFLFYAGIVQKFVAAIGSVMQPILGTSGAETLCAISNSFLGQTEAPLLVRNYLSTMTKSEFLVVMISGMGTISGAILAVFAAMGVPVKHLLASSVMAIPATIVISKIICPETEEPVTSKGASVDFQTNSKNSLDAISQGTSDGLQLALNVGAMLVAFLGLICLLNGGLGFLCVKVNDLFAFLNLSVTLPVLTLSSVFSLICTPFAWLLGFTGFEAWNVGELLGTKVAVNELVAYNKMLGMNLSERTVSVMTYALCGFSNFSCIGIQIGGIGALVPEKRAWLSELGIYAVIGGALANLLSAMVASLLL